MSYVLEENETVNNLKRDVMQPSNFAAFLMEKNIYAMGLNLNLLKSSLVVPDWINYRVKGSLCIESKIATDDAITRSKFGF